MPGVRPLSFAPARPGPAADGAGDTGRRPEWTAAGRRADDPSRDGERQVPLSSRRQSTQPAAASAVDAAGRRRPSSPWPTLPDEAGVGSPGSGRTVGTQPAAEIGTAHRDPWPALPDEPAHRPAGAGATWRESRLDREQAGG
ncbi:hypothetical protein [Micromonospora humi]|uniref:hypothetical protein n=1 Tax=Micromonospora humi TaxID=745366 RepID=UPI001112FFD5|nr:hypothetical protein [Micromonospora humi]